jgi:hypothetical protein
MTVDWRKYFTSKSTSIDLYLSKYGFKFLDQSFQKIKRAIQQDLPYIVFIKFRNSDIISILRKEEYEEALKLLLKLCIRLEFYEICSGIDKTLKQVQQTKFTVNGRKHREVTTERENQI